MNGDVEFILIEANTKKKRRWNTRRSGSQLKWSGLRRGVFHLFLAFFFLFLLSLFLFFFLLLVTLEGGGGMNASGNRKSNRVSDGAAGEGRRRGKGRREFKTRR